MELKILADTPQQKGMSFERLMGLILDKIGYVNFQFRVLKIGMELDIKAEHKVTKDPILCECKAHDEKIGPTDIATFYGKFNLEKNINELLKGFFFSISGFTGTAVEQYKSIPPPQQEFFKIYGNDQIIHLLEESGMMISNEQLDQKIKSQISHKLLERYVVFFESRIYIIQIFEINESVKRYVIYTGEGNLVGRSIYEPIARIDTTLQSIPLVDLEILEKVLLNLLDLSKKPVKQIATEITETIEDVKAALEDLMAEEILDKVEEQDGSIYSIKTDFETLTILVRKFSQSTKKLIFMNSPYLSKLIDDHFVDYISNRFKILFEGEKNTVLKRASSIFPSVLTYLLLSSPESYVNYDEQQREIGLKGKEKEKFDQSVLSQFMEEILTRIITDIKNTPTNYLGTKNVSGFYTQIDFRIEEEYDIIFGIEAGGISMLYPARGLIKPGQIVSASDMSVILKEANTLMSLKLYDRAIEDYKKVITGTDNQDWKKAAWVNMGLSYLRMHDYKNAESCFDKALTIDPELVQAKSNKELCQKDGKKYDLSNGVVLDHLLH